MATVSDVTTTEELFKRGIGLADKLIRQEKQRIDRLYILKGAVLGGLSFLISLYVPQPLSGLLENISAGFIGATIVFWLVGLWTAKGRKGTLTCFTKGADFVITQFQSNSKRPTRALQAWLILIARASNRQTLTTPCF